MASLGHLGSEAEEAVASPLSSSASVFSTTNATAAAVAAVSESVAAATTEGATAAATAELPGAFEGGIRNMGNVFMYATSKWAVMCLFMVLSFPWRDSVAALEGID